MAVFDGTGAPAEGARLAAVLRDRLGEVSIEAMTRLSGGASRETWAFDAVTADGARVELVLRRDPPGRPSEPGAMGREARAISAARAAGLAVPEILVASDGPDLFGSAGIVMRRVPGETIARHILRDDRFGQARKVLVGQLAAFAAGLHALDVPNDLPEPDPLADLRARFDEFAQASGHGSTGFESEGFESEGFESEGFKSEVFERAFEVLGATRPPPRARVLAHGDLRLGNVIVGERSLQAVIDWEIVHAGDPVEDLGWLCVRAWRFGGPAPAAGLGTREELLAAYRRAGGADVSVDELRWWETLGTLRWGVICMTQAWAHLSGAYRSVELAAIGRRVCEQEWDLLTLLEPEATARAAARRPRPSADPRRSPDPHGRPTASELLDAVRGYLTDQVRPATGGQLAFHARVASNVLAIVARELDLGQLPADADLADKVAARLAVANPRYFEPD